MSTATTPTRSTYYNYPICYVKDSKIKIKTTPSNNYISHLTGNPATGTIPTDTPDIYLRVKRKISNTSCGTEKATTNKIAAGTTVEIDLDDAVKNSVGNDTIEFEYNWFYQEGTQKINIPGNFKSTHKIYTIVDTPHAPWGISSNETPWLAVVGMSTTWSSSSTTQEAVATEVTNTINNGIPIPVGGTGAGTRKLEYENTSGFSNYGYRDLKKVCLANFLLFIKTGDNNVINRISTKTAPTGAVLFSIPPNKVNCSDCATLATAFASILGSKVYTTQIEGPKILNPIQAIGSTTFGFPFMGTDSEPSGFSYHEFMTMDNQTKVYDPCLKVGSPDPLQIPATTAILLTGMVFSTNGHVTISTVNRVAGGANGNIVIKDVVENAAMNDSFRINFSRAATTSARPDIPTRIEVLAVNSACKAPLPPSAPALPTQSHCLSHSIDGEELIATDENSGIAVLVKSHREYSTNLFQRDVLKVEITQGSIPFENGDTYEFDINYNYDDYKSLLGAPDWTYNHGSNKIDGRSSIKVKSINNGFSPKVE
jgi:hypothetical protein